MKRLLPGLIALVLLCGLVSCTGRGQETVTEDKSQVIATYDSMIAEEQRNYDSLVLQKNQLEIERDYVDEDYKNEIRKAEAEYNVAIQRMEKYSSVVEMRSQFESTVEKRKKELSHLQYEYGKVMESYELQLDALHKAIEESLQRVNKLKLDKAIAIQ